MIRRSGCPWLDRYETLVRKIAAKYTSDIGLRADCEQEARLAILSVWPDKIRNYDPVEHGPVTMERVPPQVDVYLRNVIRNSVLSYLAAWKTGSWYCGRTTYSGKKDKDGKSIRVYQPAMYTPLSVLEEYGMEVRADGTITRDVCTDGLLDDDVRQPRNAVVLYDEDDDETPDEDQDDLLAWFPPVRPEPSPEPLLNTTGGLWQDSLTGEGNWRSGGRRARKEPRLKSPRALQACPSVAAYKRGCRCDACKECRNAYRRERAHERGVKPRVLKGCPSRASFERGCRCGPCTNAMQDY
jgi:hypothetical protein